MNNAIFFYACKNIWKNKKTTTVTVICMILFVLCISITGSILNSYIQYNKNMYVNTYGDYDGVLKNVTVEQISELKSDSNVERLGIVDIYGYQPITDIIDEDYIVIGHLDNQAKELASINLLEGQWPKSADEIVLERSTATRLRLNAPVGSVLSLQIQPFIGEDLITKTYRVVGVCQDYAQVQGDYGIKAIPSTRLPNALVGDMDSSLFSVNHVMIKVQAGQDFLISLTPYIQQGGNNYYIHPLMGSSGLANSNGYLTAMLVVFLVSVIIIGVFSISTNFAITFRKKKEQLLLLKQAGAGAGQVIRFLLYQNLILGISVLMICIPFSLLISYFISKYIIVLYINGFSFSPSSYFIGFLFLFLIVILILGGVLPYCPIIFKRPLECQQKKYKKRNTINRIHPKLEKYPLLLFGGKSALYNTERTISIILSFAIFDAVLLGSGLVGNIATETLQQQTFADYSIVEYDGSYVTQLEIPLKPGYGMLQRDVEELKNVSGIEKCTTIKTLRTNILIKQDETNVDFLRNFPIENLENRASSLKEFQQEKEKYGYKQSEQLFSCNLYGVTGEFLEGLSSSVVEGKIMSADTNSIVLVTTQSGLPYSVGDTITFTQQILADSNNMSEIKTTRFDYSGHVSSIVKLTQSNTQLYKLAQHRPFLVFVNEKLFVENQLEVNNGTIWLDLSENADDSLVEKKLTNLKELYPNIQISSQKQEAEQQRMAILSVRTIATIICSIIGIFAIFSLCNTLVHIILEQKHTRGILRAIGLEKRQAIWWQFFEIAIWILFSWFVGLVLAILFSCVIEGFAFNINWKVAIIAFAFQIILGFIINYVISFWIYRKKITMLLTRVE